MDDTLVVILTLSILVAVGVTLFLIFYLMRTGRWTGSTDEARILLGQVPLQSSRDPQGELGYTGRYRPLKTGKHGHPSLLTVTLKFNLPGEFNLVRESSFDRFCKRIGLAQEIQTGDRNFDELVYIQSDHPEFARTYFADRERRQAVRALFEKGFTQIEHDGTTLTASWLHYPHGEEACEQDAHDTAEQLVPFARNIPAPPVARRRGRVLSRHSLQWVSGLGIFLGIALAIGLGFIMSANSFPLAHWSLIGSALGVALLILLVHCWCSAWLVRGHSTSHLQFWSLLVSGLCVYPLLCLLAAERLNLLLDNTPVQEHVETITNKREKKSKNSRSYYLQVPFWQDHTRILELRTDAGTYGRVVNGRSQVRVKTRGGGLGYEWIESYTVQEPKP